MFPYVVGPTAISFRKKKRFIASLRMTEQGKRVILNEVKDLFLILFGIALSEGTCPGPGRQEILMP